jgi:PKD repeat protein
LSSGATGYLWRFGDGTTSTLTNPVVNYTQNGLYQICLLSISSQGCRDSLCKPVNVTRVSTNDLPEGLTVKVSPNPTKGNIEVTLNFYKPFGSFDKLVVSDILGKQLITLNKIEANNSLDISNFTDGIYLVQLIFDGKTYLLEKVVKSN